MVSSAMLVAIPVGVDAAGDKWTSELYAWDPVQKNWVNGNLAGYHEGDLIGFKYILTHDTGTNNSSPQLDSVYDHFNKGKTAYGIDAEVLWGYNRADWTVQFPAQSEGVTNTMNVVDPIVPTLSNQFFGMSGQTIQNYYMFSAGFFTVPVGTSIYIYFQAHVAETAFYSNVQTTPGQGVPMGNYYGAAYFPGASLQVALSLVFTGTSAQTQSIPVTYAAGSISGMKFNDANSNHIRDPGESGLSNWTIILNGTSFGGFPIHMETTTASDGSYSFSQVPWGIYIISEVQKLGWTQTYPTNATHTVTVNGTALVHTRIDFGNSMPGKIRAHKIIDNDGDLTTTTDRSPGVGWTFELFYQNGAWNSLGTKVTGSDGYTEFWENLMLGNYKMVEVSAPNSNYTSAEPKYITLTTADQEIAMTFYNYPLGNICVYKFDDLNGDGNWDEGEPAVPGVTVNLYKGAISEGEEPIDSGVTGADGKVCFNGLNFGLYTVEEIMLEGWYTDGSLTQEVTVDVVGETEVVTFLNIRLGKICVFKYDDLNGDGNWDEGEPAVSGVTINLYMGAISEGEEPIDSGVTGADGKVCFEDLELGSYTVEEVLPDGWYTDGGVTQMITIDESGGCESVTFLNFKLVAITVCKLEDLTGDGLSDDDSPIEGWEVYLYKWNGEDWDLIDTNYTGTCGCHTWFDLGPGKYKVGEEEIVGWLPTTDTEHEFGPVTSGAVYSFNFTNFEVLPCINVTKSVWWDVEEEYQSHTQGYWKNHLSAWEEICPYAPFSIGGTQAVDFTKFPGGLSFIQVFNTAPKGDASIILAHQYLAAKLNDLKWGAPDVYDGFIEDAEEFLLEHPVGSNPQGEDREYALMLAEVLTDYNEGNHSGMAIPGGKLIYTVNVTNCGNVPLYNVHVYDSLLNETFWLHDYEGYEDGILEVGEWWEFTYEYTIPEDYEGDKICNVATAYGQAGPVEWDMWVNDTARVCVDIWYYAATQGYWKNHGDAWVGISPDAMFFDSGMTWMEVFWTPPAGDMIIVLAHQYMAAMLNDEMWGAPAKYVGVIEDATDFLEVHQIGDPLSAEDQQMAHDLAELLAEYNEGGIHP